MKITELFLSHSNSSVNLTEKSLYNTIAKTVIEINFRLYFILNIRKLNSYEIRENSTSFMKIALSFFIYGIHKYLDEDFQITHFYAFFL